MLIEVDVTGVDSEHRLRAPREQIVPFITQMAGFQSGTWLGGNADGQGLSFTPAATHGLELSRASGLCRRQL